MSSDVSPTTLPLTEDDIANYLRAHPNFFVDKPSLLADLELPHQSGGGTISLVEKQVSVLRERNMDMRHRLSALIDNARNNDKLFEQTKRLVLSLLEAQDINDFINALLHSFTNDFNIQYTTLVLFSEHINESSLATKDHTQVVSLSSAQTMLGTIISNNQTICGQLGPQEQQFIFQDCANRIGSTAIAPISTASPLGVLAIGNSDPDYYRSSMSTLFLAYISEVLSRLLPKHLSASASL